MRITLRASMLSAFAACLSIVVTLVCAPGALAGAITEFPIPTAISGPNGITAGPDGNLWFTEEGTIGRITPSGTITEFPIPTARSAAHGITAGPDGNLWFTDNYGKIWRITPSGTITEFPFSTAGSDPYGITAGPDGNLWFTEYTHEKIGRITPSDTITEFPIPTANSNPTEITAGPDGNLWFTEFDAGKIGRITLAGTTKCLVPKLKGKTLTQAKRLLTRSHCRLGKVTQAKKHRKHKLVVVSQKPGAGKTLPSGAKVAVRLG
jgi:streptogramin lyase